MLPTPNAPYPTPALDKSTLRQQIIAKRAFIDPAFAKEAGEAVSRHVVDWIRTYAATVISGYVPVRGELDIWPTLHALHERGLRIALPCVAGKGEPLTFRHWLPGDTLKVGAHNIFCPQDTAPALTPDLLLTPLVAFDKSGHRLGYGGGYFDRTLEILRSMNPHVKAVGVAYNMQEVDALERMPHDQRLDAVITECGAVSATMMPL